MSKAADSTVPAKRPHSPDTASAPRSSAQKRTRMAGSKNLKQHEWGLVQQHLFRRNRENKDTVFVIHGIKHDWHNVHRRILRATAGQIKPLQDSLSLPQLPSYVELRSPSPKPHSPISSPKLHTPITLPKLHAPVTLPDLTILSSTDVPNPELNLDSGTQRPYVTPTTYLKPISLNNNSSKESDETVSEDEDELTSEDEEYEVTTTGDAFLRGLPLVEWIRGFQERCWDQHESNPPEVHTDFLHDTSKLSSLGAFVDWRNKHGAACHRKSCLKRVLLLVKNGLALPSHFLETVVRKLNGSDIKILEWLAPWIGIPKFGARALGTAARRNNYEIVNTLLDLGADINGRVCSPHHNPVCRCNISAIAYAQLPSFHKGEPGASDDMIAYLISRGAAKPAEANMGLLDLLTCVLQQTVLHEDVLLSKVQEVVEPIHNFFDVVCETESVLETCLLQLGMKYDCCEGRLEVFEYLLTKGAKACSGSPLAALIYKGLPEELIWDLLERTTDINAYSNSLPRNARFEGVSLKHGPVNGNRSMSPLQVAALKGNETIVHILLQKGADVTCPARGFCGVTPLQGICRLKVKSPLDRRKKTRIVKLLLDRGANVNAAPAWNRGLSALQTAAFIGDVEVADLLVSSGADVNAPACRSGGGTALVIAARVGHVAMVRFLLRAGAAIPAAGVMSSSFGVTYDDNKKIVDLLGVNASELAAMYGGNGTPSRDYHEYEAEWAADPTYDNLG